MIVSGAGTSAVNGTYVEDGTLKGKPKYTYNGYLLQWDYDSLGEYLVWCIKKGDFFYYYYSTQNVATPDLVTTWVKGSNGSLPIPTVTAAGGGDPSSSIINHTMHYRRLRELQ